MGFVRRHGRVIVSYALLAGLGVFAGHDVAMAANANNDPHAFTISSSTVAGIAPGRVLTFPVVVSNPSTQAMHLLTLSTTVTLLASPPAPKGTPACDASKLTVARYDSAASGAAQYLVAARGMTTVPLTITFADTSTNQDGCKSRMFTLTYAGTAEQAH